jgi:hypothetical protein
MAVGSTEPAQHGCSTVIMLPIWRQLPNGLVEPAPGRRGEPWVEWADQRWFFCGTLSPFRRTKESRALRRDLEEILQEFWRGNPGGPVARRLIAEAERETARDREVRNARFALHNKLARGGR